MPQVVAIVFCASTFGVSGQAGASQDVVAIIFQENLRQAEQGDVKAQESVAFAYLYGIGAKQDDAEALRWYEQAAAAGSPNAVSAVGETYELKKDYARAFDWYSKAAERKRPHALYRLGIMHLEGWHVPKDGTKGVALVEEAAWFDNAQAQNYMGLLYAQGQSVPKSSVRAYAWLNLAARTKLDSAKLRDRLEKLMTPEERLEAQKLSLEWSDRLKAVPK